MHHNWMFAKHTFAYCATLIFVFLATSEAQQSMKFKPPQQTEEEAHSSFLPSNLLCDACEAVSYQIYKKIYDFNRLHKNYRYDLPEYEILDLMEQSCDSEIYQPYGLKEVNGENRLNGPGVKYTNDVAGMIAGGGKWPFRLTKICQSFMEELGEEEVYALYRRDPTDNEGFYRALCETPGKITSACINKKDDVVVKKEPELTADDDDDDDDENEEEERKINVKGEL